MIEADMTDRRPHLYLARRLPDPVMTALRERYRLVCEPTDSSPEPSALIAGFQDADAAIVTLTERIDREIMGAARRLKILANYAVGYNNLDLAAAHDHGIIVSNTPDVLTDATADLAWTLLLATARRVSEGDTLVRSGRWGGWTPTQLLGAEVAGRALGIVGMGRIGQAVAERAVGFRMPVLYHTRRPLTPDPSTGRWQQVPLETLLRNADFVSLHVPLNPTTTHLIGRRELAIMRPEAILINTARGPIVDEEALVEALENRTICGAGLDVYENEPALHPALAKQERTVLLPHLGSATWSARVEMGMICLRNIDAVLSGRPALNPVGGLA